MFAKSIKYVKFAKILTNIVMIYDYNYKQRVLFFVFFFYQNAGCPKKTPFKDL